MSKGGFQTNTKREEKEELGIGGRFGALVRCCWREKVRHAMDCSLGIYRQRAKSFGSRGSSSSSSYFLLLFVVSHNLGPSDCEPLMVEFGSHPFPPIRDVCTVQKPSSSGTCSKVSFPIGAPSTGRGIPPCFAKRHERKRFELESWNQTEEPGRLVSFGLTHDSILCCFRRKQLKREKII